MPWERPLSWTCIITVKGKESRVYQSNLVRTYNSSAVHLHKINTRFNKFCQIDDVCYKNKRVLAKDKMVVSTALSKSLKFKDGKYEEAISSKDDRRMPNTYSTAFKIFENTE